MTNEKDLEKQKLMKELIENSKSQEDKLTAVCGYCAGAFKVSQDASDNNINLID